MNARTPVHVTTSDTAVTIAWKGARHMKARRVVLTLEVETDAPLSTLRDARKYAIMDVVDHFCKVLQAQANVITAKRGTKSRRR